MSRAALQSSGSSDALWLAREARRAAPLLVLTASAQDAGPPVSTATVTPPAVAQSPQKAPRGVPSACVGLVESECGGKPECYWRKAALLKTVGRRRIAMLPIGAGTAR